MRTNVAVVILLSFAAAAAGHPPSIPVKGNKTGPVPATSLSLSITLSGYETAFNKEGSEKQIDGKVFLRNSKLTSAVNGACGADPLVVTVLSNDGATFATLSPVVAAAAGVPIYEWQILANAPAGRYFIRAECGGASKTETVYVIFNPAEVGTFTQFSYHNEKAVWFDCLGNQETRAWSYHLHPDDFRVFSRAIDSIQGMTDIKQAAIALARDEEDLFNYGTTCQATDIVTMLKKIKLPPQPKPLAQCADDAAVLVALLRSVGICAYTVTADADPNTNPFGWSFDTWVEFLAPGNAGNPQRWVLHPHQHPGMPPEGRNTFGTTRDVALRGANDIVLMADVPGNSSTLGVDDGSSDVFYSRQFCGEPQQTLSTKPSWVTELCEDYWSTAKHWDCKAVITIPVSDTSVFFTQTSRVWKRVNAPGAHFRADTTKMFYGATFPGNFTINYSPAVFSSYTFITLKFIADNPRNMGFGDKTLDSLVIPVKPGLDNKISRDFGFYLPPALPANFEKFYLVAILGKEPVQSKDDRFLVIEELYLPKWIFHKVSIDSNLLESKQYKAKVVLQNQSAVTLNNIDIGIETPYALEIKSKPSKKLASLRPGETKQITFTLCADTYLTGGAVEVSVVSQNGSSALSFTPVTIEPLGKIRIPTKKWGLFKRG